MLAQFYLLRGDAAEAQRWADHGQVMAERMGNVAALIASASVALVARQVQGVAVDATPYFDHLERALTASGPSQINFRFVAAAFINNGTDLERAERVMRRLYVLAGGRLREAISALGLAAVVRARSGVGAPEVERLYHEAAARADATGVRSFAAEALLGLADVHRHRGDVVGAERHATQAAEIIRALGLGYLDRLSGSGSNATAIAQPSA